MTAPGCPARPLSDCTDLARVRLLSCVGSTLHGGAHASPSKKQLGHRASPGLLICRGFGKAESQGKNQGTLYSANFKTFGGWPALENLIVHLHCVLQYLGDLQSGSHMSLLGAELLQTSPLSKHTASIFTVQCPVPPTQCCGGLLTVW